MRRLRNWILGALAVLVAASTISWTPSTTIVLTDEYGAPAADAYVRYHYEGHLVNPAHPVTYVARGSVVTRGEAGGRVRIPFRIHLRSPFPISTPPWLVIDNVFVRDCTTHSAPSRRGLRRGQGCSAWMTRAGTSPSSM